MTTLNLNGPLPDKVSRFSKRIS